MGNDFEWTGNSQWQAGYKANRDGLEYDEQATADWRAGWMDYENFILEFMVDGE